MYSFSYRSCPHLHIAFISLTLINRIDLFLLWVVKCSTCVSTSHELVSIYIMVVIFSRVVGASCRTWEGICHRIYDNKLHHTLPISRIEWWHGCYYNSRKFFGGLLIMKSMQSHHTIEALFFFKLVGTTQRTAATGLFCKPTISTNRI